MAEVQREISRIVNAKYQVSLQTFHDLVLQTNKDTLQQWAESKPCQLDPLASAIITGLSIWPFVVDVVEPCARVVVLRDSMLSQSPLLLDTFLKKAVQPGEASQKYSMACIAMLSHPLPPNLPLPASVHDFVSRIVEHIISTTSVEPLASLHKLVCGIGPEIIPAVPLDMLRGLEVQCKKIIQLTPAEANNLFTTLHFFACLARILDLWHSPCVSQQKPLGDNKTERLYSPAFQQWLTEIHKKFNTKKARGALDLSAWSVIRACSPGVLPVHDVLHHIALAIDVVERVSNEEIEAWLAAKIAVVTKLRGKFHEMAETPHIQVAIISFIARLYRSTQLPNNIIDLLNTTTVSRATWQGMCRSSLEHWLFLVRNHTSQLSHETVKAVMETFLTRAATMHVHTYLELSTAISTISMVESLSSVVRPASDLRQMILYYLQLESFQSLWTKIATRTVVASIQPCETTDICSMRSAETLRRLTIAISTLILEATYAHTYAGSAAATTPADVLTFFMRHPLPTASCSNTSVVRPHVTIAEVMSTPDRPSVSHNWRSKLQNVLRDQSRRSAETTIAYMEEVCRDLERRCEGVEQPLREVQSKLDTSITEAGWARSAIAGLKNRIAEEQIRSHALNSEKSRLEETILNLQTELQTVRHDLQSAQEEAAAAIEQGDSAIRNAAEQTKLKEIEFSTLAAAKDEAIHIYRRDLNALRSELRESERKLSREELEKANISTRLAAVEVQFESSKSNLSELQKSSAQSNGKIQLLESKNANLNVTIEELSSRLEAEKSNADTLLVELRETRTGLEARENDYGRKLQDAFTESAQRLRAEEQRYNSLRNLLAGTKAENRSVLRSKDSEISALRTKVKKLEEFRSRMRAVLTRSSPIDTPIRPAAVDPGHDKLSFAVPHTPQQIANTLVVSEQSQQSIMQPGSFFDGVYAAADGNEDFHYISSRTNRSTPSPSSPSSPKRARLHTRPQHHQTPGLPSTKRAVRLLKTNSTSETATITATTVRTRSKSPRARKALDPSSGNRVMHKGHNSGPDGKTSSSSSPPKTAVGDLGRSVSEPHGWEDSENILVGSPDEEDFAGSRHSMRMLVPEESIASEEGQDQEVLKDVEVTNAGSDDNGEL